MFKKFGLKSLLIGLTLLIVQSHVHADNTSSCILKPYSPETDEQFLKQLIAENLKKELEPILFEKYIVDDIDPIIIKPLNNCFVIYSPDLKSNIGLLTYKTTQSNDRTVRLDLDFIFDFQRLSDNHYRDAVTKTVLCAIAELQKQKNYDAIMWRWTPNRDEDPKIIGTILEKLKFTKIEWAIPQSIAGIFYVLPLNNKGKAIIKDMMPHRR